MLTNEQLIKIDKMLTACNELTLTGSEERWIEYSKQSANDDSELYAIAQKVIIQRDKGRTRHSKSLELIIELAESDGVTLQPVEPEKAETIPPLMCGGI